MAYGHFKDLAKRTASDKILRDEAFILLKIQNMMDIKEVLLLWFINFLIKNPEVVVLKLKLNRMSNQLKNYANQLLKNLKSGKYIHHLKTIFGMLIL